MNTPNEVELDVNYDVDQDEWDKLLQNQIDLLDDDGFYDFDCDEWVVSMGEYVPDKWVIVNISNPTVTIRKVLGSWYGGFNGGWSYRLSSGITQTVDMGDYFEIHNASGSVYKCYKFCHGMSLFTAGIYDDFVKNIPDDTAIFIEDNHEQDYFGHSNLLP
jgi:hypothetical protein